LKDVLNAADYGVPQRRISKRGLKANVS